MDLKNIIKNSISAQLKDSFGIELVSDDIFIERPANPDWGDYSTNIALRHAKQLGQTPGEFAKNLAYGVQTRLSSEAVAAGQVEWFSEVYATDSGFINFKLSPKWLQKVLSEINTANTHYGSSSVGANETLLVEFSQANSNKPLHIGHARNNFIGSSLSGIYKHLGYEVVRSNYIGDIGIHICKSMLMYMKHGHNAEPNKKSDHFVGDFYILFEKEVETDKNLLNEAQELLRRWEAKDPEVLELWKKMNDWVYAGWESTFKDQNVEFDTLEYESNCIDLGKEIVDIAVSKGVAEKDETGAVIARLEKYDLPDKVLLRSDGTSLYSTKDLQLALDSWNKYHFKNRLYVVDIRQSDYFKQIFKTLEALGFDWAQRLVHVQYGFVTLPEGKMSSRTGLVVNADDVYSKIKELEEAEVSKSLKDIADPQNVINKVSLAAFRYGILKVDPKQDLVFDYALVTRFDGNTGPYLMYAYARTRSVLTKSGNFSPEYGQIEPNAQEMAVLRTLFRFPDAVAEAGDKRAPNLLCNYLYDLSQAFSSFYAENKINTAENADLKAFRLNMTLAVSIVLRNGLDLLGIPVVEQM